MFLWIFMCALIFTISIKFPKIRFCVFLNEFKNTPPCSHRGVVHKSSFDRNIKNVNYFTVNVNVMYQILIEIQSSNLFKFIFLVLQWKLVYVSKICVFIDKAHY